ncbi:MAG TPA: hypothetical protein EYH56_01725 [Nanoarchaeota archaeon]|nr:hypothetical protein [Nanoarchaeota archaeon]
MKTKASTVPLVYVLVFAVATVGAFIGFPWAYKQYEISLDTSEISVIKNEFIDCSKRIFEVARVGSSQKCVFSVERGDLFVRREGIYYRIISEGDICDEHEWVLIDKKYQLWQRCLKNESLKIYELRWFYPKNDTIVLEGSVIVNLPSGQKKFELSSKGYLNVEFESPEGIKGKTLEIVRKKLEEDKAVLFVRIY